MTPFLRIARYPYEEPDNLQLRVSASNGRQKGEFEIYASRDSLVEWASAFQEFPQSENHVYFCEIGSENLEDRWAFYMQLHAFVTDSLGHCALHLRFNNNRELPGREIVEFCIQVEAAALNRLGILLSRFTNLEYEVMHWTPTEDALFGAREEVELKD